MNVTVIVVAFLALAAAVIISVKYKVNVGILCVAFAFLIGGFGLALPVDDIVGFFPVALFFRIMMTTMFFGFAARNGTVERLAEKAVYAARNHPALLPWVLFFLGFLITCTGAAPQGMSAILGVLAINIRKRTGMDYYLTVSMHCYGLVMGAFSPYGLFTSVARGLLVSVGGLAPEQVAPAVMKIVITGMLTQFLLGLLFYIMGKAYRLPKLGAELEKPAPLESIHKKTVILVVSFAVLAVLPTLLATVIPVLEIVAGTFNAISLAAVFAGTASVLRLANEREVIRQNVPWGLLLTIAGASVLVSVMTSAGLTELIAGWFSSVHLPKFIIPVLLCLVCGVLTMFVDGTSVCMPAFIPIAYAISTSLNIDFGLLVCAVACGVYTGGNTPFATGGAAMMMFVPDEDRDMMFYTVWLRVIPGILTGMAVTAVFDLFW